MILPTFLKWPGGKRRLISQMEPFFPEKIDRYFEPFMGGGSMFFYIKQKYNPSFCMISDTNKDLVETFIAVRDHPKKLITYLKYFKKNHKKEFYYAVRKKFNEEKINGIRRSAAFIYLNKTCYNGMYRVNSKGEFNVPIGKYNDPEIFNISNLMLASKLLQGVKILCQDYRKILGLLKKEDFIYLDPCYDPLKKTSFVSYTPGKFKLKDREDLFKFMLELRKRSAKPMLSNNNLELVREMYLDQKFKINEVFAARSVNSNPQARERIKELLITA